MLTKRKRRGTKHHNHYGYNERKMQAKYMFAQERAEKKLMESRTAELLTVPMVNDLPCAILYVHAEVYTLLVQYFNRFSQQSLAEYTAFIYVSARKEGESCRRIRATGYTSFGRENRELCWACVWQCAEYCETFSPSKISINSFFRILPSPAPLRISIQPKFHTWSYHLRQSDSFFGLRVRVCFISFSLTLPISIVFVCSIDDFCTEIFTIKYTDRCVILLFFVIR